MAVFGSFESLGPLLAMFLWNPMSLELGGIDLSAFPGTVESDPYALRFNPSSSDESDGKAARCLFAFGSFSGSSESARCRLRFRRDVARALCPFGANIVWDHRSASSSLYPLEAMNCSPFGEEEVAMIVSVWGEKEEGAVSK